MSVSSGSISLTAFFEGEKVARTGSPSPFTLLDEPVALQMLKEFAKIRDKAMRRSVLALVEQLVAQKER
jgi:hypothetical protein